MSKIFTSIDSCFESLADMTNGFSAIYDQGRVITYSDELLIDDGCCFSR